MENIDEDELSNWAFNTLQDVSRTFALSIEYHPQPIDRYVCAAYLLCRIPDTIEDSPELNPEQKVTLLSYFKETLDGNKEVDEFTEAVTRAVPTEVRMQDPDWELVEDTGKVFRLFSTFPDGVQDAIEPWVIEMAYGMQSFVFEYKEENGLRLETVEDLDLYCYYVAGTVGHLLTDVVSEVYDVDTDGIHSDAENFGLLLQFVNIAKDVYDDYETEQNVYLPQSLLSKYGIEQENITDETNTEEVGNAVKDVVSRAKNLTESARSFLDWADTVAGENHTAFASPYALAVATIRELNEDSELAATPEEVKIGRKEVFEIVQTLEQREYSTMENFERKLLARELTK